MHQKVTSTVEITLLEEDRDSFQTQEAWLHHLFLKSPQCPFLSHLLGNLTSLGFWGPGCKGPCLPGGAFAFCAFVSTRSLFSTTAGVLILVLPPAVIRDEQHHKDLTPYGLGLGSILAISFLIFVKCKLQWGKDLAFRFLTHTPRHSETRAGIHIKAEEGHLQQRMR